MERERGKRPERLLNTERERRERGERRGREGEGEEREEERALFSYTS